jgi:transposase
MTYSLDFRQKVLSVRERDKLTFEQVAERFSIGIASVVRWSNNAEIKPYVRVKHRKIDPDLLAADIEQYPDAYQFERAERFGVCQKAIWQALRRLEVTYKKNTEASQGERRQTALLPTKD